MAATHISAAKLDERLTEKALLLDAMSTAATTPDEKVRLAGKAEGLRLAQSYLNDAVRSHDV